MDLKFLTNLYKCLDTSLKSQILIWFFVCYLANALENLKAMNRMPRLSRCEINNLILLSYLAFERFWNHSSKAFSVSFWAIMPKSICFSLLIDLEVERKVRLTSEVQLLFIVFKLLLSPDEQLFLSLTQEPKYANYSWLFFRLPNHIPKRCFKVHQWIYVKSWI